MTVQTCEAPAPPVGVIDSLTRGFETVNSRLGLILLPLLLDWFLWVGPRLSIESLVGRIAAFTEQFLEVDPSARQNVEILQEQLAFIGSHFNVFSALSTVPLGLPSLMKTRAPLTAPIGPVRVLSVDSPLLYLLVLLTFYLAGLLLGALYMGLIAGQLRAPPLTPGDWFAQIVGNWARFLVLALILVLAGVALGLPFSLLLAILSVLSPMLAQIVLVMALALALWVMLYVSFTPHGVVMQRQGVFAALWDSVRMVQWNLPATVGLFSLVVALNWGLGYVWNMPQDDSWFLLLGVTGHAYIATALVTATFVFYQDRHRWWREVRAEMIARARRARESAEEEQ